MKRRSRSSTSSPWRSPMRARGLSRCVSLLLSLTLVGCATPHPLVHPQWSAHTRQRLGVAPIYYAVETTAATPQAAVAFQERVAASHAEVAHVVQQILQRRSVTLLNAPSIYQDMVRRGTLTSEARTGLEYAMNSLADANRFVADRLYGGLGPPLDVTMGEAVQTLPAVLDVHPEAWLWVIVTGAKESGASYGGRMGKQAFWAIVTLVASLGLFMLVPNPRRGHHFIVSALIVEPQSGQVLWWNRLTSSGDPLDVDGDVRGALATILKEL